MACVRRGRQRSRTTGLGAALVVLAAGGCGESHCHCGAAAGGSGVWRSSKGCPRAAGHPGICRVAAADWEAATLLGEGGHVSVRTRSAQESMDRLCVHDEQQIRTRTAARGRLCDMQGEREEPKMQLWRTSKLCAARIDSEPHWNCTVPCEDGGAPTMHTHLKALPQRSSGQK